MMDTDFGSRMRGFLRDCGGNFALTTALIMPLLIGAAGLAIDVSNMMMSRTQLQDATDAAALAAATALASGATDTAGAPQLAKDFVAGQMAAYFNNDATAIANLKSSTTANITPTTTSTGTSYAVTVSSSYTMPVSGFGSVVGWKTAQLRAASTTTSGTGQTGRALSIILALDTSASMNDNTTTTVQTCVLMLLNTCILYGTTYVTKIQALKQAAGTLFDTLDSADPKQILVRTGAISYANGIVDQTKNPTMNWGTTAVRKFVTGMATPVGGTDATAAMTTADATVKKNADGSDGESQSQLQKGNSNSDRYIVLMSDGEMTGNSAVWNQSLDTSVRNTCTTAKNDGITIFTVAFMAPANGKALLQYCASGAGNYYEPNTMDNLVAAFKSIGQATTRSPTLLTN